MTGPAIRIATEADLENIMVLEHECFVTDAWSRENMHFEIMAHHTTYAVIYEDDKLIAYAGLSKVPGSDQSDIQTIAVSPAARGRGLGKALMVHLIGEARKQHATDMFLEVRADNPIAMGLYRSLGFAEIGVREGYYQPDNVDAVIMRLDMEVAG